MQSKLATALRKAFTSALKRRFPSFSEDRESAVPSGWRAYRCYVDSKFTAFVILCISPKDDRFTVEVGWSQDGKLPPSSILQTSTKIETGESVRLSELWHPQRRDYWWTIGKQRTLEEMVNFVPGQPLEEKVSDVDAKVSEATEKLAEFGIPHLKRVAGVFSSGKNVF